MTLTGRWVAGAVLLCVATESRAAPLDPGRVHAEAQWVAHADLSRLRATQVGRHLLASVWTDAVHAGFAALQTVLGFDPRADLDGLTLYGDSARNGVILVQGRLDTRQLVAFLKANDSYRVASHAGYTIHSWADEACSAWNRTGRRVSSRKYGCFFDDGTLVLSDAAENVAEALDVLLGNAPSMARQASLAGLLECEDAVFFLAAADTAALEAFHPQSAMLQNVERLTLRVGETAGQVQVRLDLETPTEDVALNLFRMVEGLRGLAVLNAAANPAAARIAQAADVRRDARRLRFVLKVAAAECIEKIENLRAKD